MQNDCTSSHQANSFRPKFKLIEKNEIDSYFKSYRLRNTPFEDEIIDIWRVPILEKYVFTDQHQEELFKAYILITKKGYYIPIRDIWHGENCHPITHEEDFLTPYEIYLDGIYRLLYCYKMYPKDNERVALQILQKGKIFVGKESGTGIYYFGFTFPWLCFLADSAKNN